MIHDARSRTMATVRVLALAPLCLSVAAGGRAAAGAPQLTVKPDRTGFVQLSDGPRKRRLDLRQDVPGCLGQLYDPSTGQRVRSDASVTVLDLVHREARHYVLLSAIAPPNCNVQGMCGAASEPNVSLIWLKLAPNLAVEEKQTVVLVDCQTDRSVEDVPDEWATHLHLVDGKLGLAFRESGADGKDVSGRVEYDRRTPEVGIRVAGPR
jgi:hypothetical protein